MEAWSSCQMSSLISHFIYRGMVSFLPGIHQFWLIWLANLLWGSLVSVFWNAGITDGCHTCPALRWFLGTPILGPNTYKVRTLSTGSSSYPWTDISLCLPRKSDIILNHQCCENQIKWINSLLRFLCALRAWQALLIIPHCLQPTGELILSLSLYSMWAWGPEAHPLLAVPLISITGLPVPLPPAPSPARLAEL